MLISDLHLFFPKIRWPQGDEMIEDLKMYWYSALRPWNWAHWARGFEALYLPPRHFCLEHRELVDSSCIAKKKKKRPIKRRPSSQSHNYAPIGKRFVILLYCKLEGR